MNAGRDVERLIADWLVEESPGRAPDRVLEAAANVIDRTKQRRFAAAWREPMYVTTRGLVAAAVIGAVLIGGAAFVIKGAPAGAVGTTPAPGTSVAPSATPDALAELVAYRTARNLICDAAWPARRATDAKIGEGLYDPSISAAERATKIDAVQEQIDDITAFVDQLDALTVPAALATDEATSIARLRDTIELINKVLAYLRAGDLVAAQATDSATSPLSAGIQQFETKYALRPCP